MRSNGEILEGFEEEIIRPFDLKIGDIVERQLKNGDRVILNRQPTLHKGSMLCPKIKILKGRTLRLPISICSAYNADFDGDEMNIFVPQSAETISEAENIVATEANITTSQFPRPIINICQDNLTAGYVMTRGEFPSDSASIEKYVFFDAMVKLDYDFQEIDDRMTHFKYTLLLLNEVQTEEEADRRLFSGYGLFSMLLPKDLTVTIKNGARIYKATDDKPEYKENLEIKQGVLIRGTLDKTALGNKSGSIVHILAKDYSNEIACRFVSHFQYITDHWFLHRGFSISITDCMAMGQSAIPYTPLKKGARKQEQEYAVDPKVKQELAKAYMDVRGIMMTESNLELREMKINTVLNNVRDIGAKISKESLHPDNTMKAMIESGSKGSYMNIAQTIGLLGQQNVGGKRIQKAFRGRCFPHYLKSSPYYDTNDFINPLLSEEEQLLHLKKLLESRGFIINSYIKGLTPIEVFTHQQGGREGLLSTAISTSTTGYLQRRIVKTIEDVKCNYAGMIVNEKNSIVQFAYGDDGMDNSKLLYKNGKLNFIDIERKAEQINNRIQNRYDFKLKI
jgi:DNA-directed RNA polymerase II subunit RPB1